MTAPQTILPVGGHRKVTVMGLGLFGGGLGAARFWAELGSEVTVTDLRDAATLAPSIEQLKGLPIRYVLGRHEPEDFTKADLVMVNPAVHPDNKFVALAVQAGVPIQTEIGLVLRMHHGSTLAVTGSNGKSTTTGLLHAMVKAAAPGARLGGNIGGSLLGAMREHQPSAPLVLELSSFQLHYLHGQGFAPEVAVVTNLSPNHLDWHPTVLHYYESKRNLLRSQKPGQFAVLNWGDPVLREWAPGAAATVIAASLADPGTENACFAAGEAIVCRLSGAETTIGDLGHLRLIGDHNRLNALQAAAAAWAHAKAHGAVDAGMDAFAGLPHRLEKVAVKNGVTFIDDSIATTPESAICGLNAVTGPLVLLAGGYDKGSDLSPLARAAAERAEALVLIGKTAPAIAAAARAHRPGCAIVMAGTDFPAAVREAAARCPAGGTVLLSPACASYDMFKNFEERGDLFRQYAEGL